MEFQVYFNEDETLGLHGIQVEILDPEHFWSAPARVMKGSRFGKEGRRWEAADFNYGSGGHNKGFTAIEMARAKAAALARAAEIMEELDRLWPPGALGQPYPDELRTAR